MPGASRTLASRGAAPIGASSVAAATLSLEANLGPCPSRHLLRRFASPAGAQGLPRILAWHDPCAVLLRSALVSEEGLLGAAIPAPGAQNRCREQSRDSLPLGVHAQAWEWPAGAPSANAWLAANAAARWPGNHRFEGEGVESNV